MNLNHRLCRLEERRAAAKNHGAGTTEREWERYFHAHENASREIEGRESLPELPYTKEDYESDMRFLNEAIPAFRSEPGWQSGGAGAMLDEWEEKTREKMRQFETKDERND